MFFSMFSFKRNGANILYLCVKEGIFIGLGNEIGVEGFLER